MFFWYAAMAFHADGICVEQASGVADLCEGQPREPDGRVFLTKTTNSWSLNKCVA